jgi:hypothetical protein
MTSLFTRRLLATGAAAVAAFALIPTPAHAAGRVDAQFDDLTIGADGAPGKVFPLYASADEVSDGKLTLDLSGLSGIATVSFPLDAPACKVTAASAACDLPDGFSGIIPVKLVPGAGAKAGVEAEVTVTTSGTGIEPTTLTTKITVKSGADLVTLDKGGEKNVKIGDAVSLPAGVANVGDQTAPSLAFTFWMTHGVTPEKFSDCAYADDDVTGGTYVLCEVPLPVKPGEAFEVEGGFPATVAKDAHSTERGMTIVDVGGDLSEALGKLSFKKGTGGRTLKLVPATAKQRAAVAEIDEGDNWSDMAWFVSGTTIDLAPQSANLVGKVGDTVTANLGVKNNGPASRNSVSSGEAVVVYAVTVPAWAKAVKVPADCNGIVKVGDQYESHPGKAGYAYYICRPDQYFIGVGQTIALPFAFEIKAETGEDGKISLSTIDSTDYSDANNANNDAKITLNAAGGGGGLPVTGVQVGVFAGVGAALVAAGVLVFFLARRRRLPAELS